MELVATKPDFAAFITKQEADPRCGNLKFRDWLLSIIQRCPRYLLLLKDLISRTPVDDSEHAPLVTVHRLVSKSTFRISPWIITSDLLLVTLSLNTSLHTHAQTLSLLAIQRSTPNLPFQLISPGRSLLKRGPLLHVETSSPKEREFLLFSDCLLWLSNADKVSSGELIAERLGRSSSPPARPPMIRNRSKSDADLPKFTNNRSSLLPSSKSQLPSSGKARYPSSSSEEKWIYKGHVELVDIDVVVPPGLETNQDHRLEILSPHSSFALYACECQPHYFSRDRD
jgi:FYVE/RhoGEF/PH domain-containing protein 5/6